VFVTAKIYAMIAAVSRLVSNSWMYAEYAMVQITPLFARVVMVPLFRRLVTQPFLMPSCGVALLSLLAAMVYVKQLSVAMEFAKRIPRERTSVGYAVDWVVLQPASAIVRHYQTEPL